ncbi:transcriptional regulator [Streptomyces sp. M19]
MLRLDDDATAYLLSLAADRPRRRRRPRKETVPPGVATLVATLPLPAYVEGRYFDVLAANALATALSPCLVVGANRLRDLFLNPAEQALHPDWENASGGMVAGFRESVGTDTDDPGSSNSSVSCPRQPPLQQALGPPRRAGVRGRVQVRRAPRAGRLKLNRERLAIGGAEGQTLVVYHPDPGTDDAERLARLVADPAPARRTARPPPRGAA